MIQEKNIGHNTRVLYEDEHCLRVIGHIVSSLKTVEGEIADLSDNYFWVKPSTWNKAEEYVRINKNMVVQLWLDHELVFEKEDLGELDG